MDGPDVLALGGLGAILAQGLGPDVHSAARAHRRQPVVLVSIGSIVSVRVAGPGYKGAECY